MVAAFVILKLELINLDSDIRVASRLTKLYRNLNFLIALLEFWNIISEEPIFILLLFSDYILSYYDNEMMYRKTYISP